MILFGSLFFFARAVSCTCFYLSFCFCLLFFVGQDDRPLCRRPPPGWRGHGSCWRVYFGLLSVYSLPHRGRIQEGVYMRRSRMSRGKSRRSFTRGAVRTHKRNLNLGNPMRGGIRL